MILLDTDILTLYFNNHSGIRRRIESADEDPAITIVSRIEVLQGRFSSVLKAANAIELLRFQDRLVQAEYDLTRFVVVPFDTASAREFDRWRQNKKTGKVRRNDLLIACIALANRAALVTRNLKDFQVVPGLKLENWAE
jgi:tRNA(fMet)-specific endonuclease VapC